MKNKIGFVLIFLSILIVIIKYNFEYKINNYQNKIINNIHDNYNYIEYKGYIKIDKYNINKIIKKGTTNEILDKNYVGMMDINKENLIVLAGHNTNNVFHKIHYLKENDLIEIYLDKKEIYKVKTIKEINVDDYEILNKKYKNKTLILMTCTNKQNKRLIVISEKA